MTSYSEAGDALKVKDIGEIGEIASADMLYSVNFNTYGGSLVEAQANLAAGSAIIAPEDPTMPGCLFGGWYQDADCTEGNTWDFETYVIIEDMALHAKWDIDEDYTRVLTFRSTESEDMTVLVVTGGSLVETPNVPVRPGYDGVWDVQDYSLITEDMLIEAVYTPKDVDFNTSGEIDLLDLALLAQEYGTDIHMFDLNEDGVVNLFDLILMVQRIA